MSLPAWIDANTPDTDADGCPGCGSIGPCASECPDAEIARREVDWFNDGERDEGSLYDEL